MLAPDHGSAALLLVPLLPGFPLLCSTPSREGALHRTGVYESHYCRRLDE